MKVNHSFCKLAFLLILMGFTGLGYAQIQEDVSKYRPKYTAAVEQMNTESIAQAVKQPFVPKADVTRQFNAKLDSLAHKNTRLKYAEGYRILVYTGASSEEVAKIKEKVVALVGEETVYNIYKQPTFRIKVGDYLNRVEAGKTIQLLKADFPNAILISDQIVILKDKTAEQK